MNIVHAVLVSSVIGSILFFLSGYLYALLRAKEKLEEQTQLFEQDWQTQKEALQQECKQITIEWEETKRSLQLQETKHKVEQTKTKQELHKQRKQLEQLEQKRQKLERSFEQLQKEKQEQKEQFEREQNETKKRHEEEQKRTHQRYQEDIETLQNQLFKLKDQLDNIGNETITKSEFEYLEKQKRNANIELQQMQQRIFELEHHAKENKLLEQKLLSYDPLMEETTQMRQRILELEALLFLANMTGERKTSPPSTVPLKTLENLSCEKSIEWHIAQWQQEQVNTLTIADKQGLPLVFMGDTQFQDTLPVLSGLLQDVSERACTTLPIGKMRSIELITENHFSLSSHFFRTNAENFAFTFIEHRKPSSNEELENLLATLSTLLER